ncbi:MAG: formylglycine-generating enzyme family protein [Bacteroidales bacterium]|nr:formylglycine-generating enzyme family protein [Bacteroidales bacterium]
MLKRLFLSVIYSLTVISGCHAQKNITPEEKQWLIDKTKESLVFVEGGSFMMGDVGYIDSNGVHQLFTNDPDCLPVHKVTLDSFSIMKYEVSFRELDLYFKAINEEILRPDWRNEEYAQPQYAAKWMTWYQAQEYCEWVGELIGYPMGLPTEAQWEYAARSRGLTVAHATDNGEIIWNINYAGEEYPWYGTPPGTFPPNPLGLYDMSGNKEEWVYDWYWPYSDEPEINPKKEENSYSKVGRGFHDLYGSVYKRAERDPMNSGGGNGFRCVCNSKAVVQ